MKISIGKTSISSLGIFTLLIAMYSIGTISAIRVSWTYTIILLIISVLLLGLNFLTSGGRRISSLVICWLLFTILCLFGVLRGGSTTAFTFYVIGSVLLLTSDGIQMEALYSDLKWLKWFGLFFSAGCYWQYFFPDQYYAILYPLFGSAYQKSIRRQFTFHKMCTGFTSQTVIAAQFIILGLMIVIYTFGLQKTKKKRILSILEIIFLTGGLLLTGKRSPIINLGAALIVVDMITKKRDKRGNRFIWIALGLVISLTVLYFAAPLFSDSRNALVRFLEFTSTEDIGEALNGRQTLYRAALDEFRQHPITGIGWGKYSQKYDTTGVHNIYFQLLCECGIFGFIISVCGMLFTLFRSITMLKATNIKTTSMQATLLKCSVFIQVYILVYGIFGNPLYDQNYMLMYLLGILISASVSLKYEYLYN